MGHLDNLVILCKLYAEDPARKQLDNEYLTSVFENYFDSAPDIHKAFRLGERGSKPQWLIKITVSTERDKAYILKNSPKLRDKGNPEEIQKIFITPDLTPNEQVENKKLQA